VCMLWLPEIHDLEWRARYLFTAAAQRVMLHKPTHRMIGCSMAVLSFACVRTLALPAACLLVTLLQYRWTSARAARPKARWLGRGISRQVAVYDARASYTVHARYSVVATRVSEHRSALPGPALQAEVFTATMA
jgi:hypothetical protein